MSLYDEVVRWPTASEREALASRIQTSYDFPHCVGIIDGTLLPLAFRPASDAEDYFTRKGGYALNALICCDDKARVTYTLVAWPGSTHDNRVWSNSNLFLSPNSFFTGNEYVLGDTAFRASAHMVPAFKRLPGATLLRDREFFNTKLAKIRIRSEHCIGLIKARFQYFKNIRALIKNKNDLRRVIQLFLSVVIIHNLLVEHPVPEDLQRDVESECTNASDSDTSEWALEDICEVNDKGPNRRDQLLHYLAEKNGRF